MTSGRRAGAVAALVAVLGAAPRVRADEPIDRPSPALLGTGLVLAAGGGVLVYYGAHQYAEAPNSLRTGILMGTVGSLTLDLGVALETVWAWQLGQHASDYDRRGNLPPRSQRPRAFLALAGATVAFVGMSVGAVGIVAGSKDVTLDSAYLYLGAAGLLLVAAPVAACGFGYEAASRESGRPIVSLRLVPTLVGGAGALTLVGRF
jgi:hypothetical protein